MSDEVLRDDDLPRSNSLHSDHESPVLRASNLARHYKVRDAWFSGDTVVRALTAATFNLYPGKTLAVVGESGCGKSTLARLVTMVEAPSAGRLCIGGVDVGKSNASQIKNLRRTVQMVFQDPYGSLNPRKKAGAILEEPLLINTKMNARARCQAAHDMMARVGLSSEQYNRYPHMFSGGQRQRIAIARALMLHPRIVVLDEPLSALDVSIQAQVLNLLCDLQRELHLAFLFISHNLSVVRHIADEVMVMYLGRVVEQGERDAVFNRPRHPYTRALLSATPLADPERRHERIRLQGEMPSPIAPPTGCAFHPRCAFAEARCHREVPRLFPSAGDASRVACHGVQEKRI